MEEQQKQSHVQMSGNIYRRTYQVNDPLKKHTFIGALNYFMNV